MEETLARGARQMRRGHQGRRAALPPPAAGWAARALPRTSRGAAGWGAPGRGALGLRRPGVLRAFSNNAGARLTGFEQKSPARV